MDNELEQALWQLAISIMLTSAPTEMKTVYSQPGIEPVVERSRVKAVVTAVENLIEKRIKDEVYKMVMAGMDGQGKVVSLVDVYDMLPEREKRLLDSRRIMNWVRGWQTADAIMKLLPERLQKYYEAQHSLGVSRDDAGRFVGLCCSNCKQWMECGHAENCAVPEVAGNFDHRRFWEENVRGQE